MRIIILGLLLLAFASCKKSVYCENAVLCIKNAGQSDIHYAWNSSGLSDTLRPGEKACTEVGEISTKKSNEIGKRTTFNSDHGNYSIDVTECNMEREID